MWKSYLLYSLCVFTLLTSCNEEDIKLDASTVVDWFAVPDRPGELGHLLHKIYKETGVSIFVNDTFRIKRYSFRFIARYGSDVKSGQYDREVGVSEFAAFWEISDKIFIVGG